MTEETKHRLSTLGNQDQPSQTRSSDASQSIGGNAGSKAPANVDVQAYIGRQLRAVYDDVAKQPVPERFLDLMKQLEGLKPE